MKYIIKNGKKFKPFIIEMEIETIEDLEEITKTIGRTYESFGGALYYHLKLELKEQKNY